jgi:spore maturation protein CgeB
LNHPREREEIGKRARERILAQHTYEQRAKEMVGIIEDVFGRC